MRRLISGPAIVRLTGTPRMTVHHRLRAGVYGATFRPGRIIFADLEGVEDSTAVPFADEQLAAAAAGLPDRLIVIPLMPDPKWRPPDAPLSRAQKNHCGRKPAHRHASQAGRSSTRREAALLDGRRPGPDIALDQEIAKLERVAKVQQDRIAALKVEAEKEAGLGVQSAAPN